MRRLLAYFQNALDKPPRFIRESVDRALSGLGERVKDANNDPTALYKIADAVAFGDFLTDRPRVQSPDVGIRLVLRDEDPKRPQSARAKAAELTFLKQLRGKGGLLRLQLYEPWMSARAHRDLL